MCTAGDLRYMIFNCIIQNSSIASAFNSLAAHCVRRTNTPHLHRRIQSPGKSPLSLDATDYKNVFFAQTAAATAERASCCEYARRHTASRSLSSCLSSGILRARNGTPSEATAASSCRFTSCVTKTTSHASPLSRQVPAGSSGSSSRADGSTSCCRSRRARTASAQARMRASACIVACRSLPSSLSGASMTMNGAQGAQGALSLQPERTCVCARLGERLGVQTPSLAACRRAAMALRARIAFSLAPAATGVLSPCSCSLWLLRPLDARREQ